MAALLIHSPNSFVHSFHEENNSFNGTIPSDIGKLTKLRDINLANNALTGTIPPEIGLLKNLTELDLANNTLTGTIPPEIGLLKNLTELDLANNALTGTIPSEIGLLKNLEILDLCKREINLPFLCLTSFPLCQNLTHFPSFYCLNSIDDPLQQQRTIFLVVRFHPRLGFWQKNIL